MKLKEDSLSFGKALNTNTLRVWLCKILLTARINLCFWQVAYKLYFIKCRLMCKNISLFDTRG